jgi:hypothetical protein
MTIGGSLLLIAVGAILRFAVTDKIADVDLSAIGVILMVVGAVGALLGLLLASRRPGVVAPVERDPYVERRDVI